MSGFISALIIVALLIGSSLLCATALAGVKGIAVALPIVGTIGYAVSIFFAFCLYRDIKKDK